LGRDFAVYRNLRNLPTILETALHLQLATAFKNGLPVPTTTAQPAKLAGFPAARSNPVLCEDRSQIRRRNRLSLEAQTPLDMQEVMARDLDRPRCIARAQRLDDHAVLVHAADRLRGLLIDRDHNRGAAKEITQEARLNLWPSPRTGLATARKTDGWRGGSARGAPHKISNYDGPHRHDEGALNREHIIALEPLKNGLMGTLLRYPYEVRSEDEYFDDIQEVKITKDMLDLAKHIVEQKASDFDPDKFEDRYESALTDLINRKRNGERIAAVAKPRAGTNVVDLMTALKQSLDQDTKSAAAPKKKSKAATGQREMLLPISGKGPAKAKDTSKDAKKAEKPARTTARGRKAS
jgi:hypothetical protein